MNKPQKKKKKSYILYDGRVAAYGDTDKASVLEFLGEFRHDKQAKRYALKWWADHDGVLVSYDKGEGNLLINEEILGSIDPQ